MVKLRPLITTANNVQRSKTAVFDRCKSGRRRVRWDLVDSESERVRVSKIISLRLSEAEELRIKGAAALAGVSVSGYLKWLMTQGRTQSDTELILHRLDLLGVAIANLSGGAPQDRAMPVVGLPARDAFIVGLRKRGIPSSTIRQVEAVWDEAAG